MLRAKIKSVKKFICALCKYIKAYKKMHQCNKLQIKIQRERKVHIVRHNAFYFIMPMHYNETGECGND